LDSAHVYWTNSDYGSMKGGSVASVPLAGGKITTLATSQYQPEAIAVSASDVFFCDSTNFVRVPSGGGSSKTLESSDYPYAVAVDSTNIYWTDGLNDGEVLQTPL